MPTKRKRENLMGYVTSNHLTITPAEGYEVLPANLITKVANQNSDGSYEVDFELAVPIRRRGEISERYLDGIWGGGEVDETIEVIVTDALISATFENRDDAPMKWVENLSKKFPTAVFHLSFLKDGSYGGEVTAQAGVLTNEILEQTATAARARASHMQGISEDTFLRWEVQDAYVSMFPENTTYGHPNDGWIEHVFELGLAKFSTQSVEELTRVLNDRLALLNKWKTERQAYSAG
jgi:hypothetical protein